MNKTTMYQELVKLLTAAFALPEVHSVRIKKQEITSLRDLKGIKAGVEACYHDILSDVDLTICAALSSKDYERRGDYARCLDRYGITRDQWLGISFNQEAALYRLILKNGTRYDLGFTFTLDENIPELNFAVPREQPKASDAFWFVQIQALAKLYRGDYLIADHLANMNINETLVAQMILRDQKYGTNFHRYGHREMLEYQKAEHCPFAGKDEVFRSIAQKLYAVAQAYDRLEPLLDPAYEQRKNVFYRIWEVYDGYTAGAGNYG